MVLPDIFWGKLIDARIMLTGNYYFQSRKCYVFVPHRTCRDVVGADGLMQDFATSPASCVLHEFIGSSYLNYSV